MKCKANQHILCSGGRLSGTLYARAWINPNIKCAYLLSHLPNERDEEVDWVLHT